MPTFEKIEVFGLETWILDFSWKGGGSAMLCPPAHPAGASWSQAVAVLLGGEGPLELGLSEGSRHLSQVAGPCCSEPGLGVE